MKKVVIIGAGASGMVAAIYAARNKNEVIILEKNNICGKKILATGNGRCNYWNEDQKISHYRSSNKQILSEILAEENKAEILEFFNQIGIEPKIKNGYYYPFSNQAVSMQNALLAEMERLNIKIKLNEEVQSITKNKNVFVIGTKNKEDIYCDNIVLATGSKAAPKTGSQGFGYDILRKMEHTIIKPLPALVQLKLDEKFLGAWDGVRADCKVSFLENGKMQDEEKGEIQLTNYGVSGICIFNLSGRIARGLEDGKNEQIQINFLDGLELNSKEDFINWMDKRAKTVVGRNLEQLLEGILNYKLVKVLVQNANLNPKCKWQDLKYIQKQELAKNITNLTLKVTGTNSFDKAQVCSGGVLLDEINSKTMESKKVKSMFITGELLDVDGDCGGYNLEWAWITGMIAGKNIK